MKRNILFPVESTVRELDTKLLLAAMFIDHEKTIYIGQHNYLYKVSSYMNGGLYLGKNQFSKRQDGSWINYHAKLKKNGLGVWSAQLLPLNAPRK